MPPSAMTPWKNDPLVIVSVFDPRETVLVPLVLNSAPTDAPDVVCEMSNVPLPKEVTEAKSAIEPLPFSASVAPLSICVVFV